MSETKENQTEAKMPNVLESIGTDAKYDEILAQIIEKVKISGGLIITGTKQHGKTNASMILMRAFMLSQEHKDLRLRTLIFDLCLNFRFKFDPIPFIEAESCSVLPTLQDLIVDIGFSDNNDTKTYIGNVVLNDFHKKRAMKMKFNGRIPYLDVYLIEEAQNVLGSYALNGEVGRFWLKIVSECANYGQIFLFLGQRLADISTKVIERTKYLLIGATSGDNDLQKLKRIGGNRLKDAVQQLKRGEFIFYDRDTKYMVLIGFPLFQQLNKPFEFQKSQTPKGYAKILS